MWLDGAITTILISTQADDGPSRGLNPFFKQPLSRSSARHPPPPCDNTNEVLIRFKIENQPFLCLSEGQFLDFNFHLIYSIDRLSLHLTIIHLFNHYLLSTVRQILGSTLCIQGAIAPSRSLLSIPFSSGSRRQGH